MTQLISVLLVILLAVIGVALSQEMKSTTTFMPEACERKTKGGEHLEMHYTGYIDDSSATGVKGKVFDSSLTRGTPFDFTLGAGQVIKGWDQGLLSMCVGEKRTLLLPPDFGYGDRGAGADIPGGATLRFEVELLKISDGKPQPNIFQEIDTDGDAKITKEEMAHWFKTTRSMEQIPDNLWDQEDKDADGIITWEEFGGPKGSAPPSSDEL